MRKFIQEKLGANDLMAVIHVGGRAENSQEFTSSKRLLLAAVDKFLGKAERPATVEAYEQYLATVGIAGRRMRPIRWSGSAASTRAARSRSCRRSPTGSAASGDARSRFCSSAKGSNTTSRTCSTRPDASMIMDRTRDLIRSATKSNVSIYAIDPRGLTDMGDIGIELNSVPAGGTTDEARRATTGGLTEQQVQSLGLRGLQNELRLQHNSLRTLAEETGGFAVINTNSFDATFSRIVQDNSSYYVLAYYPPNPKRDGKFHNIQVRVNRPGVTVRARRGYANPTREGQGAGRQPREPADRRGARRARQSVAGERPDHAGVRGAVQGHGAEGLGAARRGDARPRSAARRRGQGAALVLRDGCEGQVPGGSSDTVTLNLRPETKATIQRSGMRTLSRFELPPGRYQLRVVANELATKSVGSVLYDLDVPDFTKGPLVMSGVALTSAASSRVPTVRPDDELRQVMPAPPVGNRVFPVGDELSLFAEIYDNAGGSPAQGRHHDDGDGRRGQGAVQIGGHARFVGAAGEERRLRLQHAGAAAGDAAGTVCAESRGAVASRSGTDDQSPGAVPDRGGRQARVEAEVQSK